jgi:hypothetical protein
MTAETARLAAELVDVMVRFRALMTEVDDVALYRRPGVGAWSAAECVEHLSVAAEKYVKRIGRALESGERHPPRDGARHTLWGRFWLWLLEPPSKRRLPVPPPLVPLGAPPRPQLLAHFDDSHAALVRLLHDTDAIDRTRIMVQSPSTKYIHLSLLDAFAILASHGRRHILQARRAAGTQHV